MGGPEQPEGTWGEGWEWAKTQFSSRGATCVPAFCTVSLVAGWASLCDLCDLLLLQGMPCALASTFFPSAEAARTCISPALNSEHDNCRHLAYSFRMICCAQVLSLSHNMLGGPIPEAWGGMASLQAAYLDLNFFSGDIPGSWVDLQALAFM